MWKTEHIYFIKIKWDIWAFRNDDTIWGRIACLYASVQYELDSHMVVWLELGSHANRLLGQILLGLLVEGLTDSTWGFSKGEGRKGRFILSFGVGFRKHNMEEREFQDLGLSLLVNVRREEKGRQEQGPTSCVWGRVL